MSLANRLAAQATLGRAGWRRYERGDIDVEMLENAVKDYRWCAYARNFLHISKFSMEQRPKLCGNRFSMLFSNDRQRAKMTPSKEIPDEVLRCHLERARFIVAGFNDVVPAAVLSQRDLRASSRSNQEVEQLVAETAQENEALADVDEDAALADEPDANGASGSGSNGASGSGKRKQALQKQSKGRRRTGMTAEQLQQSARDRAERDMRLTKEALEEYTLEFLPDLVEYDANNHTEDLQRDQGNGSLLTWDDWGEGETANWTTALDKGSQTDARKEAAAADLQRVNEETDALKEWQGDAVERNVKLKLLSRVANKLKKIVAGTAGFSDLSRGDWRQQGCAPLIQDGSKYTCIQDSLVVAARYVGCEFSVKQLHDKLDDPLKEAEISAVVCYARETLGLSMVCMSHGSEDALSRAKGGIAFATMQLRTGAFIIVLDAILEDDTVERHAVAFLADFEHPAYRYHYGALVDNDPRVSVRFLEPSDRASVTAARNVFDGLFWTAKKVIITSVWKVSKP